MWLNFAKENDLPFYSGETGADSVGIQFFNFVNKLSDYQYIFEEFKSPFFKNSLNLSFNIYNVEDQKLKIADEIYEIIRENYEYVTSLEVI